MTTQHAIQIQSGAVKDSPKTIEQWEVRRLVDKNFKSLLWKDAPKSSQLCIHCTNQSKYEYLGMKLCYPHYLAEERVNE